MENGDCLALGTKVYLRHLKEQDINERYLGWLHDKEITRYLEVRFNLPKTVADQMEWFAFAEGDLFAICDNKTGECIGTMHISPMSPSHLSCVLGIMIGDKSFWGQGYGTQAIRLATSYMFENTGCHRLEAGIYDPNIASIKAFLKAGWQLEGIKASARWFEGVWVDEIMMGVVNSGGTYND